MKTEIILEFRSHTAEHLNICARAEEFLALTSDDDHLHAFIHARCQNASVKLLHHLVAVRVRGRVVEPQECDTVCKLGLHKLNSRLARLVLRFHLSFCHVCLTSVDCLPDALR